MGTIAMEEAVVTEMGADAAWVLGRVHHTISGVARRTRFTLVLRRVGDHDQWDGWRIVRFINKQGLEFDSKQNIHKT